jgi:predicted O-methyltransferase YrrM
MDVNRLRQENKIWGTKDIKFWSFLSMMLVHMKPTSILEVGSGRSTTFLADAAFENNAHIISIEENEEWQKYISDSLEIMCLPHKIITHIPLTKDGWYDVDQFSLKTKLFTQEFDLVFIDGPSGISNRNHEEGINRIVHACRAARMVVVDDTHHPAGLSIVKTIEAARDYSGKFTIDYKQRKWAKKIHEENRDLIIAEDNQSIILTNFSLAEIGHKFLNIV